MAHYEKIGNVWDVYPDMEQAYDVYTQTYFVSGVSAYERCLYAPVFAFRLGDIHPNSLSSANVYKPIVSFDMKNEYLEVQTTNVTTGAFWDKEIYKLSFNFDIYRFEFDENESELIQTCNNILGVLKRIEHSKEMLFHLLSKEFDAIFVTVNVNNLYDGIPVNSFHVTRLKMLYEEIKAL